MTKAKKKQIIVLLVVIELLLIAAYPALSNKVYWQEAKALNCAELRHGQIYNKELLLEELNTRSKYGEDVSEEIDTLKSEISELGEEGNECMRSSKFWGTLHSFILVMWSLFFVSIMAGLFVIIKPSMLQKTPFKTVFIFVSGLWVFMIWGVAMDLLYEIPIPYRQTVYLIISVFSFVIGAFIGALILKKAK